MTELRQDFHDRLGELHGQTVTLVEDAAFLVENVTQLLLAPDANSRPGIIVAADEIVRRVGDVEVEVVDLLAKQAPVARDLRVVLASLRIAQISELCAGLCRRLAERDSDSDHLVAALRPNLSELGAATLALLRRAAAAWRVIDNELAQEVFTDAVGCRELHRTFLRALFDLDSIAVEDAVDLGMTARAYERLTDHAIEIAGRVVFAATGRRP